MIMILWLCIALSSINFCTIETNSTLIPMESVVAAIVEMEYAPKFNFEVHLVDNDMDGTLGRAFDDNVIMLFEPRSDRDRDYDELYQRVIIHEIGHLVYFTLSDEQRIEYFEIRELGDEYGDHRDFPYRNQPSEIFAEDFRLLFGGDVARAYRHLNRDLKHPTEVVGLREFIKGLE